MKSSTKAAIVGHLREASYLFNGIVGMSPDELQALEELREVLGHIRDIDEELLK